MDKMKEICDLLVAIRQEVKLGNDSDVLNRVDATISAYIDSNIICPPPKHDIWDYYSIPSVPIGWDSI